MKTAEQMCHEFNEKTRLCLDLIDKLKEWKLLTNAVDKQKVEYQVATGLKALDIPFIELNSTVIPLLREALHLAHSKYLLLYNKLLNDIECDCIEKDSDYSDYEFQNT